MDSTALAPTNGEIDVELVRRTIAPTATNDELALFLHDCRRRGVHPLDKLLHFTKRKGRYVPIVSIDLFRSRAGDTGEHAGTDDAVFVEREGEKFPVSAQVTVYRLKGGVRCPFVATARWAEYYPGSGTEGFMWGRMPYTMLGKCAEALALRKAFPQELGGLYSAEEMDQDTGNGNGNGNGTLTPAQIEAITAAVAECEAAGRPVNLERLCIYLAIPNMVQLPQASAKQFANVMAMLAAKKNGGKP